MVLLEKRGNVSFYASGTLEQVENFAESWAKNTGATPETKIRRKPPVVSPSPVFERFGFEEEPKATFDDWVRVGLDSYTYFARGMWTGRIKIGRSNDPSRRVQELIRSRNGEEATLLTAIRGGAFEGLYHRDFAEHLHGAEWFYPAPEILEEVQRIISYKEKFGS